MCSVRNLREGAGQPCQYLLSGYILPFVMGLGKKIDNKSSSCSYMKLNLDFCGTLHVSLLGPLELPCKEMDPSFLRSTDMVRSSTYPPPSLVPTSHHIAQWLHPD